MDMFNEETFGFYGLKDFITKEMPINFLSNRPIRELSNDLTMTVSLKFNHDIYLYETIYLHFFGGYSIVSEHYDRTIVTDICPYYVFAPLSWISPLVSESFYHNKKCYFDYRNFNSIIKLIEFFKHNIAKYIYEVDDLINSIIIINFHDSHFLKYINERLKSGVTEEEIGSSIQYYNKKYINSYTLISYIFYWYFHKLYFKFTNNKCLIYNLIVARFASEICDPINKNLKYSIKEETKYFSKTELLFCYIITNQLDNLKRLLNNKCHMSMKSAEIK